MAKTCACHATFRKGGSKWLTQCSRQARLVVNGRPLCGQHARIERKAAKRRPKG